MNSRLQAVKYPGSAPEVNDGMWIRDGMWISVMSMCTLSSPRQPATVSTHRLMMLRKLKIQDIHEPTD